MNQLFCALLIGLLASSLHACSSPNTTTHSKEQEAPVSEINSKLSSQARMMLDELPEDSNPTVGALLEVNRPVGSPERETLADAGAVVQSTTGRVVTVQVPIRSLHQVAALDFVTYVEVSTPMSPEE